MLIVNKYEDAANILRAICSEPRIRFVDTMLKHDGERLSVAEIATLAGITTQSCASSVIKNLQFAEVIELKEHNGTKLYYRIKNEPLAKALRQLLKVIGLD